MHVTFEDASPADAAELVRVQVAAFHSDAELYPGVAVGGPPGYDSLEHMLKKIAEDDCYKIVYEGRIIGVIVVFDLGPAHAHLDLIAIDPAYHSRGIGTQAIQFVERAYPVTLWTLDTPSWALRNHHFYAKLGYVKIGEEDLHDITLFAYEKRRAP